jgi:DNA-binding GntR family transcriptional regulator
VAIPGISIVLHRPVKEQVYDVLHENILAGLYPAGTWLRQEDIARRLGVSMTPVREALDLLVSSGLAERVPYRGVRICSPSSKDILDAYCLRLLLEGTAAYAAAAIISAEQLEQLWGLLRRTTALISLHDMPEERFLSRELHSAIVAAAGNPLLHKTYLTVLNSFPDWMLYEHLYRQPDLLQESMQTEYREHSLIVEALADRNRGLAVRRTIEHMRSRGRELEAYLGIPAKSVREHEDQVLPLLAGLLEHTEEREPQ